MTDQQQGSYAAEAISLMKSTVPLLVTRMGIYAVFGAVALAWFGFWAGLALTLGYFLESVVGVIICLILSLGFAWPLWRLARKYVLYLVRAPYVAAITELMMGRDVPEGFGQFGYGKEIVEKYFVDVSVLWIVHEAVQGVVRTFARTVMSFTRWLPGSLKKLRNMAIKIVHRAGIYVDDAVFSYTIAQRNPKAYEGATDALLLYAENPKPILMTAAKTYVIGKVITGLLSLLFIVPTLLIVGVIGSQIGGAASELVMIFGVVMAIFAAHITELALFEPFALAYAVVTFHRETEGQQPNPEWQEKLEGASDKVKELFDRRGEMADRIGETVGSGVDEMAGQQHQAAGVGDRSE